MNKHKLAVLGVVAAVALVAALWSTQTRRPVQEALAPQSLVPNLEQQLNDVSTVRIRGAGDQVLATLVRGTDGWTLTEKGGYAVDVSKLRAYLLKLAQARRVEEKTSTPALYDRLGVEPMSDKQAYGAQLELEGIEPPVKLIVGRNVPRGSGTYVRFVDEAQSWEVSGDLAVERVPANWLQRDLTDIAATRIERVDVTPAKGPAVHIVRAAPGSAGDFAVADIPKGREVASEYVADATAGVLSGLRFDDLLAASEAPMPAEGVTKTKFVAEDGVVVDLTSWVVEDKTRATFVASLDEAKAEAFVQKAQEKAEAERAAQAAKPADAATAAGDEPADEAPSEEAQSDEAKPVTTEPAPADPAADREQRLAALRDEVAKLNARFTGWVYVLPPFKAENLNKPLESYLKPKA